MTEEDDNIIAFEEDDDNVPPKEQPKISTRFKHKQVRQQEISNEQAQEASEDGPVINFTKLFKTSKEAGATQGIKVDSQYVAPMAKSLFLNPDEKEEEDDDPGVLKLEDPEDQPLPPEEGDVFIKSKSNRSQRSTPKKDESILDVIQKYDGKNMENSLEFSVHPIGKGTTEQFPASQENRDELVDTIFSQQLKIGIQSTDPKTDFYGISMLTQKGSLFQNALKMSLKRAFMTPILPFIIIITILDYTMTSVNQFQFFIIYILILASLPTFLWYRVYRQELDLEFKFDRQLVSVFDFAQKRFSTRSIIRLFPGCIVQLKKGDRVPAPMIILSAEGREHAQVNFGDDIKTYKVAAPKLQEPDLTYIDGQLEFNQLPIFSENTKARLRLDLVEPIDVQLNHDNLVEENGIVESSELIGVLLHSSTRQKYLREALSFNLPLYLNPLNSEFFSIGIAIVLSITFSIAGSIWSSNNKDKHLYIREQSNYNFISLLIDRLIIFSNIVPIFVEVFRPIFLLLARKKVIDDIGMDPQRSGQLTKLNSYIALDNLANTKFVNYGQVLNEPKLRVGKATLLGGPQGEKKDLEKNNDDVKLQGYEPKPNKEIMEDQIQVNQSTAFEQIDLEYDAQCDDKERSTFVFERALLTLPYKTLNPTQLAVQKYCQLGECVQFSYDDNQRSVLLPKEVLRTYTVKLIVNTEQWDAYLYEMPLLEEKDLESDDEEASDLQQLQDRIKKDRELFEKMNSKRYIWVLQADIESTLCKEHPQLSQFMQGKAIFEYTFQEQEYQRLYKQLGSSAFKRKYIQLPPFAEEQLMTQIKPCGVFQFQTVAHHNFHLLLDMNLAIIRQWFFIRDVERDQTLQYLKQYMECVEFTKDDLHNEMNSVKSQAAPLFKQSTREFKVFDNLYKIDDKFITLIINQEVLDQALSDGEMRSQFYEVIMIASFVVFHDLTKIQIEQLITFQKDQSKTQAIVSVGLHDEDLCLCKVNTIRASVQSQSAKNPSLFSAMSHVELVSLDGLSKLILTHARQTHVRTAGFLLFILYKGFLITMCEFFFSFFNGYSSTQLFTTSFHFMFQTYFTPLYGFLIFSFYSDVNHRVIRMFASEFIKCQRDYYFNRKKLFLIFFDSVYQGFIIFYLPANILQYANNQDGIIEGFYYISLVSYLTVLLTTQMQPILYLSTLSKEQIVVIMFNITICILILFTTCSSETWSTSIAQYIHHLEAILDSVKSVFIVIFLSCISLTPTIILQQFETVSDSQLIRMIHYYEEKEEVEEEPKQKAQEQKPSQPVDTKQLQTKGMEQSIMIEQTSQDQINMSQDNLLQK
ncbi:unnamed protein product (macronuclear) [Paramecium tetraurelia]|uniref:P-type ATPase C-terminal domain-containing protein n=1 Tax=Paramecium tetraurelia TaxID=5888 RepID=A0BDQ1_PARTE|nr:uncharacterized protein GSPATT00027698001 [Paramecium tetraurelia]CAK56668.1 unnamed protein product [Paramecium tetraurelia]|eukprot:XP_001424066.1 hypothetical protein (macronuclear) [Paramecium tetraurelia strain d4-2]